MWLQAVGGAAAIGAETSVEGRGMGWQLTIKTSKARCERLWRLPLEAMSLRGIYPTKVGAVEALHTVEEGTKENEGEAWKRARNWEEEASQVEYKVRPTRTSAWQEKGSDIVKEEEEMKWEGEAEPSPTPEGHMNKRRRIVGKQKVRDVAHEARQTGDTSEDKENHGKPLLVAAEEEDTEDARQRDLECGGHKRKRRRRTLKLRFVSPSP